MSIKEIIQRSVFVLLSVTAVTGSFAQNVLKGGGNSIKTADSLYMAKNWKEAKLVYESILRDTSQNGISWNRLGFCYYNLGNNDLAIKCFQKSLASNPILPVKASAYSRMVRIHAIKNEKQKALTEMDSAINAGYSNLTELDSLPEFNSLRAETAFKQMREKVYAAVNPCMVNPQAREFDFWIGEWDVYVTGTKTYAGHSLVQMIANGCALLENWDSPASNGKSINYIDPVNNKWKQAWAGSYSNGIQEFINGEYKNNAMHFVFETTDARGNKLSGRFIFYNEGPNQVRQFNETSADGGKTWTTNYDFTYLRKSR